MPAYPSFAESPPSTAADLNELLVATSNEDHDAFRKLYDLAAPRLYAVVLRMLREPDLANDVFQEAFVKIWAMSARYDPTKGEAIGWMITLTRRVALDHLRNLKRHPLPDSDLVADTLATLETLPQTDRFDLQTCLDRLTSPSRKAIVLSFVFGLSHAELATTLAKPVGTVKSWIKRGLANLRTCLDAVPHDG